MKTVPLDFQCSGAGEPIIIEAAADAAEGKPSTFSMTAYTGVPMSLAGFWNPVIVDLESLKTPRQTVPVLRGHDGDRIAGHTNEVTVSSQRVKASGVLSGIDAHTDEVKKTAKGGFPWQASIGASAEKMEYVGKGETIKVNGRNWDGPLLVARGATIREISLVPIGADNNTAATVAASFSGVNAMTYDAWLRARGHDPAKLNESDNKLLRAEFDFQANNPPAPVPPVIEAKNPPAIDYKAELAAARAQAAAEIQRHADITARVAKHGVIEIEINGAKVNLAAHAVAQNWTADQAELHALRAARPTVPGGLGYSTSAPEVNDAVLEAAVLQASGSNFRLEDNSYYEDEFAGRKVRRVPERIQRQTQSDLRARYTDQVQQAAHTRYRGRIGLQQILTESARRHGYNGSDRIDDGNLEAVLRAQNWIRADGASTASLANVLANVMNKFLLQGYLFAEQAFRDVCGVRPVKDFKATKSISLFGDFTFDKLSSNGELKNASMQDQAFANQAETYGRFLNIDRKQMINDDLGALTTAPMLMGIGAIEKLNDVVYTLYLNPGYDDGGSTNFFAATHTLTGGQLGNSNYSSGAGSALASAGLTAAELLFNKQIKPTGKPLGVSPSILFYPPELDTTARELMNAQYIVYGGGSASKQPNTNTFAGRFKPVMSRYLSNSSYTGYSTAAWYLLADPTFLPAIEICYLSGQELPTVQSVGPDFQANMLGISMKGFFDFGVAMQNFRGGVKSAGS